MTIVVGGVDPGLDGALAFISQGYVVAMIGMPTLTLSKGKGTKREISVHGLLQALRDQVIGVGFVVERVFIERVSPRPGEGTVSAFKFGRGVGQVETAIIALGWPVEYVTPPKWKKALGLPAGAQKDDSLQMASRLFPSDTSLWTPRRLVMNKQQCHGRAEAALLGVYGEATLSTDRRQRIETPPSNTEESKTSLGI